MYLGMSIPEMDCQSKGFNYHKIAELLNEKEIKTKLSQENSIQRY